MPEGGFFEQKRLSPTSLTIVVAIHAAAIGTLMMAKMEPVQRQEFGKTVIDFIKPPAEPPPPEPKKQAPTDSVVRQKTVIEAVPPKVPLRQQDPVVLGERPVFIPTDIGPVGNDIAKPADPPPPPLPPPPQPDPVRVEARMDPRSQLQPPYPAAEERMEREGKVSIRVTIGADGRVKAAAKLSATSDAFFRETERHALKAWRFKPATVDGKPVESSQVLTVVFRLDT
jgi:protein TonB